MPWPGDKEGNFRTSSQAAICLPHTAVASHRPFNCWTSRRETLNSNFYSYCFNPTGNRNCVYRFSSRRFICSITDQFKTSGGTNRIPQAVLIGPGLWTKVCWLSSIFQSVTRRCVLGRNNGRSFRIEVKQFTRWNGCLMKDLKVLKHRPRPSFETQTVRFRDECVTYQAILLFEV